MNPPAPGYAKCLCRHCNGPIEFETEGAGEDVDCPHCGLATVLFVPQSRPLADRLPWRWIAAGFFGLAMIGIFAAFLVKYWDYVVSFSGGVVMAFVAVAMLFLLTFLAVLWIVFPVFVFFGMQRMERTLNQIERNTRPDKE